MKAITVIALSLTCYCGAALATQCVDEYEALIDRLQQESKQSLTDLREALLHTDARVDEATQNVEDARQRMDELGADLNFLQKVFNLERRGTPDSTEYHEFKQFRNRESRRLATLRTLQKKQALDYIRKFAAVATDWAAQVNSNYPEINWRNMVDTLKVAESNFTHDDYTRGESARAKVVEALKTAADSLALRADKGDGDALHLSAVLTELADFFLAERSNLPEIHAATKLIAQLRDAAARSPQRP